MKVLVLFSGGVDSTVCLGLAVAEHGRENVAALSINYGQKHAKELAAAKAVADFYAVEQAELDLSPVFAHSDCPLLSRSDKPIPRGSYTEQSDGSPAATYVPFRNGLFLSAAASVAVAKGCGAVYYGAHRDDSAGSVYPDCSPTFNAAMSGAVFEGSGGLVKIIAPFLLKTKTDIVGIGLEIGAPLHLTWSCYEGGDEPCGKCGTCIDREKAFAAHEIKN